MRAFPVPSSPNAHVPRDGQFKTMTLRRRIEGMTLGFIRGRCQYQELLAAALLIAALFSTAAHGQTRAVFERNLPPAVVGQGGLVIGPQQAGSSTDATPLGVNLNGVRLIGPREDPTAHPTAGVSVGDIGDIPRDRLSAILAPYLRQPLSPKLIADIQTSVAQTYRDAGYPFVSVTVPPQEITGGVVQFRVTEFRYGTVTAKGAAPEAQSELRSHVRAQSGERIATAALEEDLDWLNRYPYHSVEGIFAPGDALGASALTLEVTPQKPWQVFAGWSNTGTPETGEDRYFAGFGAALPQFGNSFVSYQATGSEDFWSDPGSVGDGAYAPNYASHAARFVFSPLPRQSLEIVPNYVATRQNSLEGPFSFTNTTFELPVVYRTAISNILPGHYWGDLSIGAVGRHVTRDSYFDGTDIGGASADVFEGILGWAASGSDAFGRTQLEARLVVNPGGILGGNNAETWAVYSAGRVDDVTYAYATLDASRVTRLPAGLAYVSQFSGLWASQPLPDTEQLSLGGMNATRGYGFANIGVDSGLVWRNEVRFPALSIFGETKDFNWISDEVSAYAFFDLGYGYNFGFDGILGEVEGFDTNMAGIGGGVDYRIGKNMQASFVAGYALTDAGLTHAGDWTLQGRLFLSY